MIVGFCGLKNSGKDTAGNFLVNEYGYEKRSIAAKMKEALAALFDVPVDYLEKFKSNPNYIIAIGEENDEFVPIKIHTFRHAMQRFGSEVGRDIFGKDFWLDQVLPSDDWTTPKNIVICDVRFPNEAQRIQNMGGKLYEVYRKGVDVGDKHIGEDKLKLAPYIDFVLYNDGTIEELYQEVEAALRSDGVIV